MKEYIISDTGVKVFSNYKDNIDIDKDNKVLSKKANLPREKCNKGKVKGLSRFGSENSEDAKTFNLFRGLELNGRIGEYYNTVGITDTNKPERLLFWGMDSNTGESDAVLKTVLDKIEPPNIWKIQQTEPDIIIIGNKTVVFNESKLGRNGATIEAWNRKKPLGEKHEFYKKNAKQYFNSSFIENFSVEGRRFYQLLRNFIIGQTFADSLKKQFHLVALVNSQNKNKSGLSHQEEFEKFKLFLNKPFQAFCHLTSWDKL